MTRPFTPAHLASMIALFLLGLIGPLSARAEGPTPFTIPTTSKSFKLDGRATEDSWKRAALLKGFSTYKPRTGLPARFQVEGRVIRNRKALFLFFRVHIPSDKIFAPMAQRDSGGDLDNIQVIIDPGRTERYGYSFRVTASSILRDALITLDLGEKDLAYDSLFDAKTRIEKDFWTAEMRIPFQSLRFDPKKTQWGLQILVGAWSHQQTLSWTPVDRNRNNFVAQFRRVAPFDKVQAGRVLEVLPSTTLSWAHDPEVTGKPCQFGASYGAFNLCGAALEYSLGVKWAITPALTLDVAFNPDFSQVEADARQLTVNNRFALYLEERRPFFVEGREIFESPLGIFYSRSIGRPEAALKLTGSHGRVQMGALFAWDGQPPDSVLDDGFSPSENSFDEPVQALTTVARGQYSLGAKGRLGLLAIDKQFLSGSQSVGANQVVGLDSEFLLTNHLKLILGGYYSHANSLRGEKHNGYALDSKLIYRTDHYRVQAFYQRLSPDFRAEAGYIPRVDYHSVFAKIDAYHRSDVPWRRSISPGVWVSFFTDDFGALTERKLGWNTYWKFGPHLYVLPTYERIAESIDGAWLDTNQFRFKFGLQTWRQFQLSTEIGVGDTIIRSSLLNEGESHYVGRQFAPTFSATIRPTRQMSIGLAYKHRMIWREWGGEKLANEPLIRGSLLTFFNRDLYLRAIVEWDGLNERVTADVLLSYVPSPGTVFFLGYREGTQLGDELSLHERSVFLKFSYLFNI